MKYPTDIVLENGWARIHEGHGLDVDALRADLEHNQGLPTDGENLNVEEIHFGYLPRIKWCADYGGCDQEGDWHSHWYLAKPTDTNRFTLVYWQRTRTKATVL